MDCGTAYKLVKGITTSLSIIVLLTINFNLHYLSNCIVKSLGKAQLLKELNQSDTTLANAWSRCYSYGMNYTIPAKLTICHSPDYIKNRKAQKLSLSIKGSDLIVFGPKDARAFLTWLTACLKLNKSICPPIQSQLSSNSFECPVISIFKKDVYTCLTSDYRINHLVINGFTFSNPESLTLANIAQNVLTSK